MLILEIAAKNWENIFWFWHHCIWTSGVRHLLLLRVNTCHQVSKFSVSRFQILLKQIFASWFPLRMIKNMTKRLPCRFKQSFGPFNMLSVHKGPDTGLFTYLSYLLFPVNNFRKKSPLNLIFVWKYCKFYVDSWNAAKRLEDLCWFWDNCI